ncbi:MAG: TonB-dependent receptor domain-containing protein [Salinibacter sp.]|uniref:TonB-dependent receptor n=1 Tax=Salinibacter sp. TaxID=2065818 RepID=UPI0035D3E71E
MHDRSFWHCLAVLCLLSTILPLPASAQSIQGRVLNEKTDAPIERANVLLQNGNERQGTSTDARGRFQIDLAPGEYTVEVSALGYQEARRTVTVRAGESTSVTFTLSPREYSLNEIVVSGQEREVEDAVSTVQQVDYAAIESQDAADVSELAGLVPATHVQTNSRGQTILYFRNAGDRQVGQFFDGALLNIPWDNRVNISLIPASVVEEITVTKGVPSVRYGANVLGGAINFQSRTLDSKGQRTELNGALGTAEQRRASITHLGRTQNWDYTAAVQYNERGNQPLSEGTNLQNNQPLEDRRINTDRQMLSAFGRVSRRFENGGQLAVSVLHVDAEQGVAPEGNATDAQSRYWRYPLWQKSTVIASGQVPLGTNTSLRGAAWGSRFARDIADYESIDYQDLNQIQEGRDLTGGLRLIGTQNFPLGSLTLSLNGLTSRHEKTTLLAPRQPVDSSQSSTYRQHIFSTGLEYEAQVHSRVQITAGASVDGTATPETGPFPDRDPIYTWGMNTGIRIDAGQEWVVRGAFGRKTRFPTMRELFGAAIGKFVPNPNLKPVSAWIGEAGVEYRTSTFHLGSTAFLNRVYNTIDKRTFQEGPNAGKEQRINLQGARIYGLETTVRWTPTASLVLDGNLTWSHPRGFTEDGTQRLDEKPTWLGTGRVSYELPFGLSVMGQGRYTGGVYARNEQNEFVTLPSSPSLVVDARLSYALSNITSGVDGQLYVRGENLTDEAVFIGLGLPRPGRSFRVGLEVTL